MPPTPRQYHPGFDPTPSSTPQPEPRGSASDDENRPEDAEFLANFGKGDGVGTEWYSPEPIGYVKGRTRYVVVIGTVMSGRGM